MGTVNFKQAFTINVRLYWEVIRLTAKILIVELVLFALGLTTIYFVKKFLYTTNSHEELLNLTYTHPQIIKFFYKFGKPIYIACIYLIIYYFYRKPFIRSLKSTYKNFRLEFSENQPSLKFYLVNCVLNYAIYLFVYVTLSRLLYNYSISQAFLSEIGLENSCGKACLISLLLPGAVNVCILERLI